jgi:hypothetical protein
MSHPSSVLIDHCTPSQLKALLALAASPPDERNPLAAQAANPAELRRLLTELCQGEADAGELLLSTVCTPETPLEALRGIKELAKKLLAEAKTDAHRSAATFLYHAAIAAAFGHHGVDISSRPISARSTLYEDLAAALAGDPLGHVFRQALDRATDAEMA